MKFPSWWVYMKNKFCYFSNLFILFWLYFSNFQFVEDLKCCMLYLHFSPKQPSSRSQWLGGGLKCILICPSRTPIKNITTSYTRRHFGTWQIVLQNVIKKIMTHHSRTTIKNKNIFHTKIFWYLAKSIKKNYQKY